MARSPSRSRSRSRSPSMSRSRSPVKRGTDNDDNDVATCPFLIRLFITKGRHVPLVEFDEGNFPIRDEFQTYGWKTSTPSSLIALVYASLPPPYRSPLARFSFRHIYVDASQRGLYRSKDLVSFTGRDLMTTLEKEAKPAVASMDMELDDTPDDRAGRKSGGKKIEEKTLDGYGFITGDLLSVSLHVPEPKLHQGPNRPPGSLATGGMNGPAPVDRLDRGGFGWGDRDGGGTNGPPGLKREIHPADKEGSWSRGEALPPPAGRPRGSIGRDREGGGMGIRGMGRRRSPSLEGRNGGGGGGRDVRYGGRHRSRSPDRDADRRDSYSRR